MHRTYLPDHQSSRRHYTAVVSVVYSQARRYSLPTAGPPSRSSQYAAAHSWLDRWPRKTPAIRLTLYGTPRYAGRSFGSPSGRVACHCLTPARCFLQVAEYLSGALGEEAFRSINAALCQPPAACARVNTLRATPGVSARLSSESA